MLNRIVTRGLGPSIGLAGRAGLVTQGFGGTPEVIVRAIETLIRRPHGRSSRRDREQINLITLWAKLVEVNGQVPKANIEGKIAVPVEPEKRASVVAERVSHALGRVWVTVKRIKRDT